MKRIKKILVSVCLALLCLIVINVDTNAAEKGRIEVSYSGKCSDATSSMFFKDFSISGKVLYLKKGENYAVLCEANSSDNYFKMCSNVPFNVRVDRCYKKDKTYHSKKIQDVYYFSKKINCDFGDIVYVDIDSSKKTDKKIEQYELTVQTNRYINPKKFTNVEELTLDGESKTGKIKANKKKIFKYTTDEDGDGWIGPSGNYLYVKNSSKKESGFSYELYYSDGFNDASEYKALFKGDSIEHSPFSRYSTTYYIVLTAGNTNTEYEISVSNERKIPLPDWFGN